jgi:hypothetical protein
MALSEHYKQIAQRGDLYIEDYCGDYLECEEIDDPDDEYGHVATIAGVYLSDDKALELAIWLLHRVSPALRRSIAAQLSGGTLPPEAAEQPPDLSDAWFCAHCGFENTRTVLVCESCNGARE